MIILLSLFLEEVIQIVLVRFNPDCAVVALAWLGL